MKKHIKHLVKKYVIKYLGKDLAALDSRVHELEKLQHIGRLLISSLPQENIEIDTDKLSKVEIDGLWRKALQKMRTEPVRFIKKSESPSGFLQTDGALEPKKNKLIVFLTEDEAAEFKGVQIPLTDFYVKILKPGEVIENLEGYTPISVEYLRSIVKKNAADIPVNNPQHVQELTELPEKWAIRITPENVSYLNYYLHKHGANKYRDYKSTWRVSLAEDEYEGHTFVSESKAAHTVFEFEGYTEITFAQFEKWVLNKRGIGWYESMGALVYYDGTNIKCGFNSDGEWMNVESILTEAFDPAPHSVVEAALIEEAKRRYKEGDCVNGVNSSDPRSFNCKLSDAYFYIDYCEISGGIEVHGRVSEKDYDKNNSNPLLFKEGQWAEVITPAEKEIDWSVPGQLVTNSSGDILLTTGDHTHANFDALVIEHHLSKKKRLKAAKSCFKPFTGEITISNEQL